MKLTFITLFPEIINCYFGASIQKKAIEKELIEVEFIDLKEFSPREDKRVDNKPIGGGVGMVVGIEAVFNALKKVYKPNSHIILPTPSGKKFKTFDAKRLSKKKHLIFICPRYEGIDERVAEFFVSEVFSIGEFILTGGELASLAIADSTIRFIDGVLGNKKSLELESFENNLLEPPLFTKPNSFKNLEVIKEYLKGNHAKISLLKNKLAKIKTRYYAPNLFERIKNEK